MPEFNYQKMIDDVLQKEGGFVNHPADRGGPTNYGITLKTLSMYLARNCTADDVAAMTKQTARDIYYAWYYIKPGINTLPEAIRPIVFDMTVNSGKHGIKILQAALIASGYDCGCKNDEPDGKIGPATISAANAAWHDMGNELIRKLVRRRVIFYEGIVRKNDSQRVFLAGWINRAESFLPEAAA